jgi:precorrin-2 dehydrogenase / sirohydrochlorin ferrochelatase
MNNNINPYYAIFLNISGERCIVIGGGKVALRKVMGLLEHKANVQVISPVLCSELLDMAKTGEIRVSQKPYQSGDLEGAAVVIAATDNPAINAAVAKESFEKKILVNVVDEPEISAFILPACLQRGGLTIAISTSGRSPALARKLRVKLEAEFGEEYAALVELVNEVRLEVKRQGIETDGDNWQKALDLQNLIDLIKKGQIAQAREVLKARLQA